MAVFIDDKEATQSGFTLHELKGDLFNCPVDSSLAHCISADCKLGKGIAAIFKRKFGGIGELKKQDAAPGGLAVLKRDGRVIFNLVTKERYFHKPTYKTLEQSLEAMKDYCKKYSVQTISMPQIGCGLDGLKWDKVRNLINDVFRESDISITVYRL